MLMVFSMVLHAALCMPMQSSYRIVKYIHAQAGGTPVHFPQHEVNGYTMLKDRDVGMPAHVFAESAFDLAASDIFCVYNALGAVAALSGQVQGAVCIARECCAHLSKLQDTRCSFTTHDLNGTV